MPRFSKSGADMYICQMCCRNLDGGIHPSSWRPDITKLKSAGNVCPTCVMQWDSERFNDTARGAILCLRMLSSLDLFGATAVPDPSVEGVWLVRCTDATEAVVYLAGYRDACREIRKENDFEVVNY